MIRRTVLSIGLASFAFGLALLVELPFATTATAQEAPAGAESEMAAQDAPAAGEVLDEPAPAATQNDFQAAQQRQAQARTLRGYWHLFIAFAVTWLLLFGYAMMLGRRFGRLERELERIGG